MGHNSSAALMIDGQLVGATLEERYSKSKNHYGYPYRAIVSLLNTCKVLPSSVDMVCFSSSIYDPILTKARPNATFTIPEHWKYFTDRFGSKDLKLAYHKYLRDDPKFQHHDEPIDFTFLQDDKILLDGIAQSAAFRSEAVKVLKVKNGVTTDNIHFLDHHSCHAYYAYHVSPYKDQDALVVTLDGWGDGRNQTVFLAKDGNLSEILDSTENDLGRIYKFATLILGMIPDEHEFKVMGLAAYSKHPYYDDIYNNLLKICDVYGGKIISKDRPADLLAKLSEIFAKQRFDNIAGAVQKFTETIACKVIQQLSETYNINTFILGGGVSLNIKMSLQVSKLAEVHRIFVPASPGDETLSVGACYYAYHNKTSGVCSVPPANYYLGEEATFSDADANLLLSAKCICSKNPSPRDIAALLASGKIVGIYRGRAEFGARALGNRSILADPRNRDSLDTLNKAIKSRDFWMPFAFTCLDKYADRFLNNPKEIHCKTMSIALDTNTDSRKDIVAAIHPYDKTARPQILSESDNPFYFSIIDEFEKLSGVGALLNTSLNLHGSPVVGSADDVITTFLNSNLDAIVACNYLFTK